MNKNKYIKQQNNDLELYCGIMLIPLVFCAIANYTFSSFFGGYILFGIYMFSFVCLLIFNRRQKNNNFDMKALLAFLSFGLVYFFAIVSSRNTEAIFGIMFFSIAVLYAFGVLYNATNFKMMKYISKIFLISITITVVLSVKVLIGQPGASRILASQNFDVYGRGALLKQGLAGFGITYSLIFLIPVFIYWLKYIKKKTFLILLLVLLSLNIILSGYTTAFLLTVLAICLYLFTKLNGYAKFFVVIFSFFLVVFQSYFLPDFFYYIADLFGSEKMSEHLVEIADILAGKSSIFDLGRVDLLEQSWEAFLSNPIFGVISSGEISEVGGHSTFFDILGTIGLVGIVPYCMFLRFFHNQVKKQIKNPMAKKIWTIESVIFFALQILNPILSNYEIVYSYMCIVPAILFYIEMLGEQQIEACTD